MEINRSKGRSTSASWMEKLENSKMADSVQWGNGFLPTPFDIGIQAYQPSGRDTYAYPGNRIIPPPVPLNGTNIQYSKQSINRGVSIQDRMDFPESLGEEIYDEPMNEVFISVLSTTSLLLLTFAWFRAAEKFFTQTTKNWFGDENHLVGQAILTTIVITIIHFFIRSQSNDHKKQMESTYKRQRNALGLR